MTYIVGVIGAALLAGLLAVLRPAGGGCGNPCAGCTGNGACKAKGQVDARDLE
ncbi:MAG TPA: hypothetical protein VKA84_17355 [Gemmatimonadaceae bacterium]|nr:hypothetical protein [Gemmatimonadaceae bacterium]